MIIKLTLWFLLTPLRFANALYYNIWIHGIWSIRDNFTDIFNPKINGMRFKKSMSYMFYWVVGMPFRIIKYSIIGMIQLLEGLLFVAIDTIFPALTMYHGTQKNIAVADISKSGKWIVGDGNYAGSGIYFTMDKSVAKHYAGHSNDSVIICCRVTLGSIINLNFTPSEIRDSVKYNGDKITEWGLRKNYTCTEWWREGSNWWEYCLLNYRNGTEIKTWRVRILYTKNITTNTKERIWGGKAFWLL